MIRTFDEHGIRHVETLDGRWEFTTAADRADRGKLPTSYARSIQVPSAWEMLPGLESYRGTGWYRTSAVAYEGMALRLVFGGVSHTGTVHVDGKTRGTHYDAFTPWDVVVPYLEEGQHDVVVEVDNTFGKHSALHMENDYMTYGGITRPVEIQYVPAVYIDKIFATPVKNRETWSLDVRVRLTNWSKKTQERSVVVQLAGYYLNLGEVAVEGRKTVEISGTIKALEVEQWSPDSPTLYELQALLFDEDEPVDDLIDRIGFRETKVRGKKILFNGTPIRLRGYNRHEDHGQFGNAIPLEAMVTDLEILRDLGCNTVRTCHYPNDMRFLDLCDEMGFYVWEEHHARSVKFDHPKFDEQIETSTTEMVEWHFNRPSIVMWGCLNECDSVSDSGHEVHEQSLRLLKQLDPSRPTTFASDKRMKDTCLGLVDIVSWNIYTGWYGGTPAEVKPVIDDLLKWLHSDASHGGKGKPVIMSEFGAGAIYGYRHPSRNHWTEEYQDEVLDETLRVYLNHKDIIGALVWQFCDCRVTAGSWRARPRTMNNKGIVDEFRRPKLAYETVKTRMIEAADKWDK